MRKLLELCVQSNSAGGGYSSSAFCRLAEGIAADCSKGPGGAALLAEALRINTGLVTLDVLESLCLGFLGRMGSHAKRAAE